MQRFPDLSAYLVRAGQVKAVARLTLGRQVIRIDLARKVKSVTSVAKLDRDGYGMQGRVSRAELCTKVVPVLTDPCRDVSGLIEI